MHEMRFPLDIIFIRQNTIVAIFENLPYPKSKEETLPVYKPEKPADSVLEINGGLSKKYGFKAGDHVNITY